MAPDCEQWRWIGSDPDGWTCARTPGSGNHRSTWKDLHYWATALTQIDRGDVLGYLRKRNSCPIDQTFKAPYGSISGPMQVGQKIGALIASVRASNGSIPDVSEHRRTKRDPNMPVLCPNCWHRLCIELVQPPTVADPNVLPLQPVETDPIGRLYGASMLNNVWHDGNGKTRARSMRGHDMIRHANAMIGRRAAELAQQYQKYQLFEVTDAFREEMGVFRTKVQNHFGSAGRRTLRMNGADVNVPTQGVEITQLDGDLLIGTVDLSTLYPEYDEDAWRLYQLAERLIPPMERSVSDSTRGNEMRQFGVRKHWFETAETSIPLLKINSGGDYDSFLALAASMYAKMQTIEACVLPECTKRRLAMRDVMAKDSVCGLPGLEEFLYAVMCTITREYYPDLHR